MTMDTGAEFLYIHEQVRKIYERAALSFDALRLLPNLMDRGKVTEGDFGRIRDNTEILTRQLAHVVLQLEGLVREADASDEEINP